MTFRRLSEFFTQLEETTLRNRMVEILADLFQEALPSEIGKLCYLLQGRVAPLYEAVEFGIADKMMIRAISQGLEVDQEDVVRLFKSEGDLGKAVEKLKTKSTKQKREDKNVSISQVYKVLYKVATAQGEGSQEEKVSLLGTLLGEVDPLSARSIIRMTLGKLRLGFSDMTILDSLSWMLGKTKEFRPVIEKAYNVRPDLGFISQTVKEKGVGGLSHIVPKVGTPILMARADRLTSAKDILEKIGKCAVEFKYDGLRLQAHKHGDVVSLFSRNLENVTAMFPDIVASVKKHVSAKEAIFEGEIVAYNPKTGVSIAFQQTMQRKRKYNIEEKAQEIPVKLFVFELLFLGGRDLIHEPYSTRKSLLKKIIIEDNVLVYAKETIVEDEGSIDKLFHESVKLGYEGIIAKRLSGAYQAGMRGWNWIKFKKAMSKKLMDTFDVVVMGYTKGEGKRTNFGVGQFLTGVLDEKRSRFVTISKIGTGLTDEQFREFMGRIHKLKVPAKPVEYEIDKLFETDVWLRPSLVVEVGADEITRSQVHTAGRVMVPSKSGTAYEVKTPGFALRFPRLERFRDDKGPSDVTTLSEVEKMFREQGKKK